MNQPKSSSKRKFFRQLPIAIVGAMLGLKKCFSTGDEEDYSAYRNEEQGGEPTIVSSRTTATIEDVEFHKLIGVTNHGTGMQSRYITFKIGKSKTHTDHIRYQVHTSNLNNSSESYPIVNADLVACLLFLKSDDPLAQQHKKVLDDISRRTETSGSRARQKESEEYAWFLYHFYKNYYPGGRTHFRGNDAVFFNRNGLEELKNAVKVIKDGRKYILNGKEIFPTTNKVVPRFIKPEDHKDAPGIERFIGSTKDEYYIGEDNKDFFASILTAIEKNPTNPSNIISNYLMWKVVHQKKIQYSPPYSMTIKKALEDYFRNTQQGRETTKWMADACGEDPTENIAHALAAYCLQREVMFTDKVISQCYSGNKNVEPTDTIHMPRSHHFQHIFKASYTASDFFKDFDLTYHAPLDNKKNRILNTISQVYKSKGIATKMESVIQTRNNHFAKDHSIDTAPQELSNNLEKRFTLFVQGLQTAHPDLFTLSTTDIQDILEQERKDILKSIAKGPMFFSQIELQEERNKYINNRPKDRGKTPSETAEKIEKNIVRQECIDYYKDAAIAMQQTHGIPASITLAQILLETNGRQSKLARKHNLFGIKVPEKLVATTPKREKTRVHDDCCDTKNCNEPEFFRVFESDEDCFNYRANKMLRGRYKYLTRDYPDRNKLPKEPINEKQLAMAHAMRNGKTDPYTNKPDGDLTYRRAYGFKGLGYATDPYYAEKLLKIINTYHLRQYDIYSKW